MPPSTDTLTLQRYCHDGDDDAMNSTGSSSSSASSPYSAPSYSTEPCSPCDINIDIDFDLSVPLLFPATSNTEATLDRPLTTRLHETTLAFLTLALTSFGGAQAQAMVFDLFVLRKRWVSERTFADLFAIANATPGPVATKLAYALALGRNGLAAAVVACVAYSLPGALLHFSIGLALSRATAGASVLPAWVPHVQNGLSAVAVALVALAGARMAAKLLHTTLDRAIAAGALAVVINFSDKVWVVPVVMVIGAGVAVAEGWWNGEVVRSGEGDTAGEQETARVVHVTPPRSYGATDTKPSTPTVEAQPLPSIPHTAVPSPDSLHVPYTLTTSLVLFILFLLLLLLSLLATSLLPVPLPAPSAPTATRFLHLIATFTYAGSALLGGGTVLVPLLHSLVVPTHLMPSEFLLGLALASALPGPAYNFSAFVGALAMRGSVASAAAGAVGAWVAVNVPGVLAMAAAMPAWERVAKGGAGVKRACRGCGDVAVGLVGAGLYVLVGKAIGGGGPTSLLAHPGWVAVSCAAAWAVGSAGVAAPVAVVAGGVVGALEYMVGSVLVSV
ncbi:hypothetical protein HDU96_001555 [Phlyctochytrium bullatum]|nr:hypothetical protein HDU96_001555 [Phlyctochytrium bullatum]